MTLICPDPASAEALAILEGLKFAIDNGWSHVVFETNSASIANKVNNIQHQDLSTVQHLVSRIRSTLCTLPNCKISYVPRDANLVAHVLATSALRSFTSCSFDCNFPDFIRASVNSERFSSSSQ